MRHASFLGFQAFLRRFLFLAVVLTGAFASAQALTNGNFESPYVAPNIDGWLKTMFLNPSLAGPTPYNGTSIVRNAGGVDKTSVFNTGAGPETQVDSDLGGAQSLRWPKFGASCVLINDHGRNRNGNSITQTFTLDNSMLDAGDGRLHLRFAFAPVLENPGHTVSQQPYFNIDVRDVSKANVILYDNLNFSNQPGSPWKTTTSILTGQTVVYTDWQIKDIALDPAVYLNDTIQIEFVAAGCSLGGHFGKLYVDGIAAVIPGLWVSVSSSVLAPPLLAGGTIRYTYTVRNTGATPQTNVNINAVVPVNTTFVSLNDPGGRLSQAGGVISTTLPFPTSGHTMAPGDTYTFTVDVTVNGGTAAGTKITSGNYYAQADNYGSLYGSPVYDYVAGAGTDLAASMTAVLAVNPCNTQFTVTVTNNGPATASLAQASLPMPVNSTLVSATTTMGLVTGANPVVASLGDMASGATATFTVIVRPTVNTSVSGTVTVSGNYTDTVPANNSATASYANAAGGPAVSITTQPVGGTFPSGSTPTLTVAASGGCGGPFYQWYLNGAAIGGATGTSYTTPALAAGIYNYTVRVTEGSGYYVISNVAVVTIPAVVTVGALTNGTLDVTTPSPASVTPGSTTSFKFNANPGYHVASISGCSGPLYTNTSNAVTTYTYTTGVVTADCTITATFAINTYQVSASAGANGTLDVTTPSPVTINYGSTTSFKFNANLGYHIASISGCSGPLYTNTSNAVSTYTYTTGAITADCTVTATFAINTYGITATSGPNGTISPSGLVVVNYGSNQTFTLTPNAAFGVLDVVVDGVSQGGLASYTFLNVTGDHTISAVFAPGEEEPNNNYVQATRVPAPGLITGRILVANDLDYYRVTLPAGSTLTATLMPLSSPTNLNYFVYIYNQAGNIVAQSTRSGGVVNTAYIRNNSSTAFYYYVVIRAPYGVANPNWYRLNINW